MTVVKLLSLEPKGSEKPSLLWRWVDTFSDSQKQVPVCCWLLPKLWLGAGRRASCCY